MRSLAHKRSKANLDFQQLDGSESAEMGRATRRPVFFVAIVADRRDRQGARVEGLLASINAVGDGDEDETHHGDDESVADCSVSRRRRHRSRLHYRMER